MTRRRLRPIIGVALVAAACSSGVDSSEPATAPTGPAVGSATDPALVELPPPPTTPTPSTSALAATTTTSTTPSETVALGAWDWGAPCRVPVEQRLGPDNLAPDRTFDLVVTETGEGFLLEFEDVEASKGSVPDDQVAQYLSSTAAALPSIRLDEQGRFAEFVDLDLALVELAESAGETLGADVAREDASILQSLIERQTFEPWFGFWIDRGALTITGSPVVEERSIIGVTYDAEVTASAAEITSDAQLTEFGGDAARFAYSERGSDIPLRGGGSIAFDVEADAIISTSDGRPHESTVWLTMFDTSDGRRTDPYFDSEFRYVFQTWFDWENAEGCA